MRQSGPVTFKVDLAERIAFYQRTRHDLEMLDEIGFCKGIENYPAISITPCVIQWARELWRFGLKVFQNAWFGRFARKEKISADAL